MRGYRTFFMLVVAMGVAGAVVYGFWPGAVPVETKSIARERLYGFIEELGETRVSDQYVISSPVSGYVERSAFDVGDSVSAGASLAVLEPLPSDALDPRRRAEAQASVERGKAALRVAENRASAAGVASDFASLEFARTNALYERQMIAKSELDRVRAEAEHASDTLRSARAEIDVARYELKLAETVLEHSMPLRDAEPAQRIALASPIDGQVLGIAHESEGVVDAGTPLVVVGDVARLEVKVDLLSPDAVQVRPGMRVVLDRWGGEQTLTAVVKSVEPTAFTKVSALGVEEQRVWVILRLTSPREAWINLGDGYRVQAKFILWENESALTVPASALFRVDGGWAVFEILEGRARHQLVDIGRSNAIAAEVLDGLVAGDAVIVHPGDQIRDGTRVRPRLER